MEGIEIVSDFADEVRWNEYVVRHPAARFCHRFEYGCISDVYGYTPHRIAFLKSNKVVGVLPAFETRSLIFGRKLVSQPFSEYGGPLLDADLSDEDMFVIWNWLGGFLKQRGVSALEMHGCFGIRPEHLDRLLRKHGHQSAYLDLSCPVDEIWERTVSYEVRKAVRKAERAGLVAEECSEPEIIEREFYPLYLASMKRLGAPAHGVHYFLRCRQAFGAAMQIFWAKAGDVRIAGLLGFACGQRINIVNTVSEPGTWDLRPNDFVHWAYIKWAHQTGFRWFDFGSIRYEGQLRYKKKWGCTVVDHAHYFLPADQGARLRTFDSSSDTMQTMAHIWSRYVPNWVARRVGPSLRRHLVR
jgi:CelD/BcsL family acetyltransferase involved in cellulose biosynthesis